MISSATERHWARREQFDLRATHHWLTAGMDDPLIICQPLYGPSYQASPFASPRQCQALQPIPPTARRNLFVVTSDWFALLINLARRRGGAPAANGASRPRWSDSFIAELHGGENGIGQILSRAATLRLRRAKPVSKRSGNNAGRMLLANPARTACEFFSPSADAVHSVCDTGEVRRDGEKSSAVAR